MYTVHVLQCCQLNSLDTQLILKKHFVSHHVISDVSIIYYIVVAANTLPGSSSATVASCITNQVKATYCYA